MRSQEIAALLDAIEADPELAGSVRHHEVLAPQPPTLHEPTELPAALQQVLARRGIRGLYTHQLRALEALRQGHDVVLATPTASGKSLVYRLPALEALRNDPEARALFVFPLKALSQDQRNGLVQDLEVLGPGPDERQVAIYDGDTPQGRRRKIRQEPPGVLITTPDMLHLGILPNHASWEAFFRGLRLVVVDELHAYRGVFGSHVAQVLRRLDRVARHHGARPNFVCASATVANPGELAAQLTGRRPRVVESDGSGRTRRHVLLMNPQASPYTTASRLFRLALDRGLRSIAFTKARRITELMHQWVVQAQPELAAQVSSYRSGFLPEERREIERRLFSGELRGVISTSALEMGIDVGGLDVCLLVGYPGSQIATWQRAGRVGRSREALVALVAQPDALDQYLVGHPRVFFDRGFEHAVLDPHNPEVVGAHLPCAAAELPLRTGEAWLDGEEMQRALRRQVEAGELLESEDSRLWFAARRLPHRAVNLRQAGAHYTIERADSQGQGRILGSIGSAHVFVECHEGAIYLHHGRAYLVRRLDLETRRVWVEATGAPWYTRALTEKQTEILERTRSRARGPLRVVEGRVRVTTRVTGYERRRLRGQDLLATESLELPPTSFETTSIWLEIPDPLLQAVAGAGHHDMGSLHALEHATLSLFPLFALCDRFDVAGISTLRHAQTGLPTIFFYDAQPGGLGLASGVFARVEAILETTVDLVEGCGCASGCPACVHSPRCGHGNRPIDKAGAVRALAYLTGREALPAASSPSRHSAPLLETLPRAEGRRDLRSPPSLASCEGPHIVVFDLETQRSAEEVGGWHNAHLMRLALAVTWDSRTDRFQAYREREVEALLESLARADLVVGFNAHRFDYRVLRGYTDRDLRALPTFDLLDAIHARLGFRLALGHLGEETLGAPKSADGLQALRWWRQGRLDEIERYCRQDVTLLRDLFHHALRHGFLLFRTRGGERVRLPLPLSLPELLERAHSGGAGRSRGASGAAVEPHVAAGAGCEEAPRR